MKLPLVKTVQATGLVTIIIGLLTCALFLFHTKLAFIGPTLIAVGLILMIIGCVVRYISDGKIAYDRQVDEFNESFESSHSSTTGHVHTMGQQGIVQYSQNHHQQSQDPQQQYHQPHQYKGQPQQHQAPQHSTGNSDGANIV